MVEEAFIIQVCNLKPDENLNLLSKDDLPVCNAS